MLIYVVLPSMLDLCYLACVGHNALHIFVRVWFQAFIASLVESSLAGSSHYGGVLCFTDITNLKGVCMWDTT